MFVFTISSDRVDLPFSVEFLLWGNWGLSELEDVLLECQRVINSMHAMQLRPWPLSPPAMVVSTNPNSRLAAEVIAELGGGPGLPGREGG
jgi:hypothetical protein